MGKKKTSKKRGSKKSDKKRLFRISAILLILAVSAAIFLLYENNKVYSECYVEAGVEVTVQDFLREADEQAYFAEGSDVINSAVPGEYHVKIKTGLLPHKSVLYITDTIAPAGDPVRVNLEIGRECEAALFTGQVTDATAVTVSYAEKPDFSKPGLQEVRVILTDMGGNQTELTSELFVSLVVEELHVEAGSAPPGLKDFVIRGDEAAFLTNIGSFDYTVPADQEVKLRVDGAEYITIMHIVDTVPPEITVRDLQSFTKVPRKPEEFVVLVKDVTEVDLRFNGEPDITLLGEQTVAIVATDQGGNETVKEARLILSADTEPPVITGVEDLTVLAGDTISYKKNVTVTDNCSDGLELIVDSSKVNLSAEGEYPVTYLARDASGNETAVAATVIVKPRKYDLQTVYALADSVLEKIITPEMTPREKALAIYHFNTGNIAYVNHSEKSDWAQAAYEGLADRRGDCYVYACTAKVLLDRAGIRNMDIEKIPTSRTHYWNLVDLGDGWYHFDTTPRRSDHPMIFMWTEAQLMEYSGRHYGSHNYDHTLYPEVN